MEVFRRIINRGDTRWPDTALPHELGGVWKKSRHGGARRGSAGEDGQRYRWTLTDLAGKEFGGQYEHRPVTDPVIYPYNGYEYLYVTYFR